MSLEWSRTIGVVAGFLAFSAPHSAYCRPAPVKPDQPSIGWRFYVNGILMGAAKSEGEAKLKAEAAIAMVRRETARRQVIGAGAPSITAAADK